MRKTLSHSEAGARPRKIAQWPVTLRMMDARLGTAVSFFRRTRRYLECRILLPKTSVAREFDAGLDCPDLRDAFALQLLTYWSAQRAVDPLCWAKLQLSGLDVSGLLTGAPRLRFTFGLDIVVEGFTGGLWGCLTLSRHGKIMRVELRSTLQADIAESLLNGFVDDALGSACRCPEAHAGRFRTLGMPSTLSRFISSSRRIEGRVPTGSREGGTVREVPRT